MDITTKTLSAKSEVKPTVVKLGSATDLTRGLSTGTDPDGSVDRHNNKWDKEPNITFD